MKHINLLALVTILGVFAGVSLPAQIVPIILTPDSYTVDAIMEGPTGIANGGLDGSPDYSSGFLVTQGDVSDPSDFSYPALPQDGVITNSVNGAVFDLNNYAKNNVAVIRNGPSTLSLAPQSQGFYSEISFLLTNSALTMFNPSPITLTLNYADLSSSPPIATDGPPANWFDSDPSGGGEAVAYLQALADSNGISLSVIQLDEYDFTVAPGKILTSITVDPGSNVLDVYAVSGIDPAIVPEPQSWLLVACGLGLLGCVLRRFPSRA